MAPRSLFSQPKKRSRSGKTNFRWHQYTGDDSENGGILTAINSPWLKPNRPWGLAVYRTCDDDEAAWQTWRTRLDENVRSSLEDDLENNIEERTIDEKRGWTLEPLHQGTRYTVFAVFDDICVESMHRKYPGPLLMLVRRDWKPLSEADMRALMDGDVHEDYEHGYMCDHSEGPGGWIYQDVASYTTLYHRLRNINDWSEELMYPSQAYTSGGMLILERSPAFWREERAVDQGGIVASTRAVAARS